MSDRALIRRETAISVVINMAISAAFFVAMFGTGGPVAIDRLALDCVPQAFMVALMGSLVPGLLASRRLGAGRPGHVALGAVATAMLAALIGGGGIWLLASAAPSASLPYGQSFALKIAFGGVVAAIATPLAIKRVLRRGAIFA